MCNLSDLVYDKAFAVGFKQGFEQTFEPGYEIGQEAMTLLLITSLMKSLDCDIEYAMYLLEIDEEEHDKYIQLRSQS